MTDKIDGGRDLMSTIGEGFRDALGVDDDATVEAEAEAKAGVGLDEGDAASSDVDRWEVAEDDDAWSRFTGGLSEAVDGLTQAAQGAEHAADGLLDAAADGVDEATKTVSQMQHDVEAATREQISTMLDGAVETTKQVDAGIQDVVAGGEELYRKARGTTARFVETVEQIAANHPQEAVAKAAEQAIEGTWQAGRQVFEAAVEMNRRLHPTPSAEAIQQGAEAVDELASEIAAGIVGADELVDKGDEILKRGILTLGAEAVLANEQSLQDIGEFLEGAYDNRVVNFLTNERLFGELASSIKTTRNTARTLANVAKSAPEVAKKVLEPEVMKALTETVDAEAIEPELLELESGKEYRQEGGLEVSVHEGFGGLAGGKMSTSVERTAADIYKVTIDVSGKFGVGGGEEAAGQGAKGDGVVTAGGKLVLEFSGAGAAHDAACLMGAAHGEYTDLLKMTRDVDARVLEATGSFSQGVKAQAFDSAIDLDLSGEKGFKVIDGKPYNGIMLSAATNPKVDTGSVQIGDDLARGWLQDGTPPTTGNPGVDTLMQQLPPDVIKGVKQIYGPQVGLTLSAEPKVSVGFYTPVGKSQPLRATFSAEVSLRAGRSELKGEVGFTVKDVGALAEALGVDATVLAEKLAEGEMSLATLKAYAEEQALNLDRYMEFSGPTLTLVQENMLGVKNLAGLTVRRGTVTNSVVYEKPDKTDVFANLARAEKLEDVDEQQKVAYARGTRI